MKQQLAFHGGQPVSKREWPRWPPNSLAGHPLLEQVLSAHRWTIRGWYTGQEAVQRKAARNFAAFCGSPFCTLTSSGSTALLAGLEALDIGAYDEVIVPVYTWIASAIAVLNVNAVPVFVDVDPQTGCISPEAVEDAITPRSKAIMPVHLHCAVANMQPLQAIANKYGLKIIEDCAQAHGASYQDKPVGTLGHIGAFSFNQEKVLACGEGGAIITDDPQLFDNATRSHADGARLVPDDAPVQIGAYELIDGDDYIGANYCMSDFQAVVLLHELGQLAERNRKRAIAADYLNQRLANIPGVTVVPTSPNTTSRTFFRFAIRRDPEAFNGIPTERLCEALSAELGFPIEQTECKPLHQNPLYKPLSKRRYHLGNEYVKKLDVSDKPFPIAEAHFATTMVFHHRILLAEEAGLNDIATAFEKVHEFCAEL